VIKTRLRTFEEEEAAALVSFIATKRFLDGKEEDEEENLDRLPPPADKSFD
jgi:hypothetical protein